MPVSRSAKLVSVAVLGLCAACAKKAEHKPEAHSASSAASSAALPPDVVAKVNGEPITESEVQRELTSHSRQGDKDPDHAKGALEGLIREELAYQKALAMGLDSDPGYQNQVRRLEQEMRSVKRRALADVFYRNQIVKSSQASDDEVKAYFDENAPKLRAEMHVWQMLVRSEAKANELADRLKKGEAFDAVAKTLFPEMPGLERKPWDLGYLGYSQVPEPWRTVVYDLKPGQTSGVIAGPNDRFWIIKLLDRRDKPNFTLANAKPAIVATLRAQKSESLRAQINDELRKDAKVEYVARRGPAPQEPEDEPPIPPRVPTGVLPPPTAPHAPPPPPVRPPPAPPPRPPLPAASQ